MRDDLISREAAIDALRYAQHRFTVADEAGGMGTVKWSEDVIYFAAAEKVLANLPSAGPERKVGKWVEQPTDGRFGKQVECSECGEVYWAWMANFGYCPNCGADMRGENDGRPDK